MAVYVVGVHTTANSNKYSVSRKDSHTIRQPVEDSVLFSVLVSFILLRREVTTRITLMKESI